MPKPRTSIEDRFKLAQIAIGNALADPTLLAALTTYGYNADRLQQGNVLREQAWKLYQQQKGEYGELSAAKDALETAQQQARTTYMHYIKVARLALKHDRGASQKLDLTSGRKRPQAKWLAQARQFYTHALSDAAILGKLAECGITQAMLEAGQRQIEAAVQCEATRWQCQGAARDATKMRDETIAALDTWIADFIKFARLAFERRPQLLEKLGIKKRGTRAATRTPGSVAPSAVALGVEASTPTHDSDQPASYSGNGLAPVSTS
jgi:hypothetical protein